MVVGELVELFLPIYYVKSATTQVIPGSLPKCVLANYILLWWKNFVKKCQKLKFTIEHFFVQIALILHFLAQVRNQRYKIDPSQD